MNNKRQCGNIDNNKSMPRPFQWSVMIMHVKGMETWGVYEPFHIMLNEYSVADIVITPHAKSRYTDRISKEDGKDMDIGAWIWQCVKQNRVRPYSQREYHAYLIDNDTSMVVQFKELEGATTISGDPLYVMIVVTFLGNISSTPQLRDLRAYFSWLRHSRRIKLVKKRRRRR
ncbi:hypothetical protein [Paenibacillus sp. P32E]|uniref:hypothetical protein n=1 Tax=Paenibacillus sp. P32E TaxID=1349434 RepID=UPI00273F758C|nr:hypothetical protein [Paenibacillus sp. P32E]